MPNELDRRIRHIHLALSNRSTESRKGYSQAIRQRSQLSIEARRTLRSETSTITCLPPKGFIESRQRGSEFLPN
ncbi:MAG: hypothetical protein ACRDRT_07910 [Pseudonocardiaceae bacterium]